jgi:hypothetical protein
MISIISDFDSVYQIRRRLGSSINGHPLLWKGNAICVDTSFWNESAICLTFYTVYIDLEMGYFHF